MFQILCTFALNVQNVSCVSVSPRSQSLPWVSAPPWRFSALPWWPSVWLWWSSAPPWWAPAPPWRPSAPTWRVSAPPWWAPAPSAPPWMSSALSALHWWSPALFAPPWRPSAPPWRAPAPSAPPWWALVLSAPPWCPALPALPQFWVSSLLHGPGPPSLPLFHLRSTALLDCSEFGASGSRSLGVSNPVCDLPSTHHQRSLFHHIDSQTTHTVTYYPGLHFPSFIALSTHSCLNHMLTHPT